MLDPSPGGLAGRFGKAARSRGYPLGPDAARRHQLFHILAIAFGTSGGRVAGRQRQLFETVTARFALVFINRHGGLLSKISLNSVPPQMVGFGSEQGLSNFETHGVAVPALAGAAKQVPIVVHSELCRKSLTGYAIIFKRAKTPLRAKRCRLWMGT